MQTMNIARLTNTNIFWPENYRTIQLPMRMFQLQKTTAHPTRNESNTLNNIQLMFHKKNSLFQTATYKNSIAHKDKIKRI